MFGIYGHRTEEFNAGRSDAGLPFLRLHDLRHTAATALAQAGMNLAHVGQILGHSNIKTTQRHVKWTTPYRGLQAILEKRTHRSVTEPSSQSAKTDEILCMDVSAVYRLLSKGKLARSALVTQINRGESRSGTPKED